MQNELALGGKASLISWCLTSWRQFRRNLFEEHSLVFLGRLGRSYNERQRRRNLRSVCRKFSGLPGSNQIGAIVARVRYCGCHR